MQSHIFYKREISASTSLPGGPAGCKPYNRVGLVISFPEAHDYFVFQMAFLFIFQKRHLENKVVMSFWEAYDETHTVVRFATSWATREEDVDALISLL